MYKTIKSGADKLSSMLKNYRKKEMIEDKAEDGVMTALKGVNSLRKGKSGVAKIAMGLSGSIMDGGKITKKSKIGKRMMKIAQDL